MRQQCAGCCRILVHLFHHCGYRREVLLIAEPRLELYFKPLAVEISLEIEKVHFEQWLGTCDCRAGPEARYSIMNAAAARAPYLHGENSVQGTSQAARCKVSRGVTQLAPETLPPVHSSDHAVRSTQQLRRLLQIACLQCTPNRGAADSVASNSKGVSGSNRKTKLRAEGCH